MIAKGIPQLSKLLNFFSWAKIIVNTSWQSHTPATLHPRRFPWRKSVMERRHIDIVLLGKWLITCSIITSKCDFGSWKCKRNATMKWLGISTYKKSAWGLIERKILFIQEPKKPKELVLLEALLTKTTSNTSPSIKSLPASLHILHQLHVLIKASTQSPALKSRTAACVPSENTLKGRQEYHLHKKMSSLVWRKWEVRWKIINQSGKDKFKWRESSLRSPENTFNPQSAQSFKA